jgi:hypothetical protein
MSKKIGILTGPWEVASVFAQWNWLLPGSSARWLRCREERL